jgi:CBS domain-containing protein
MMKPRIVRDIIEEGRDLLELPAGASVRDAAQAMRDWDVGAVLVTENGRLAGIFTERDLVNRVIACDRDPESTPLSEVMTRDPDTISPKAAALEALRLMEDGGYRHVPVVAEGRLVGIVSGRDFLGSEKDRLEMETGLWERL